MKTYILTESQARDAIREYLERHDPQQFGELADLEAQCDIQHAFRVRVAWEDPADPVWTTTEPPAPDPNHRGPWND